MIAKDPVSALCTGKKASLRPLHDALMNTIQPFGDDLELAPQEGHLSLRRLVCTDLGLDTDQRTCPPAPAARKPGPRLAQEGYRVTPVSAAQYLSSWSWISMSRAAGCAVRGFW